MKIWSGNVWKLQFIVYLRVKNMHPTISWMVISLRLRTSLISRLNSVILSLGDTVFMNRCT